MADTTASVGIDAGRFSVQSDHVLKEGTAEYERGQRLRSRVISARPYLCIERARFVTQSYRETEHEHILTRRAKAFESIMRNMSV